MCPSDYLASLLCLAPVSHSFSLCSFSFLPAVPGISLQTPHAQGSAAVPEEAPPLCCRRDVVISGKRLLPPRSINRADTPQALSASHPQLHLLTLSLCVCPCCILGSQVTPGEGLVVWCNHQVFDSQKLSFPALFTNAEPSH